ncbi:hypothetical protein C0583_02910 [Candidatus Parcubacteria bacterium]|nr:MAG: hypothetical protein C0583_02910 [Candidatus Parcubacteria bacterium]
MHLNKAIWKEKIWLIPTLLVFTGVCVYLYYDGVFIWPKNIVAIGLFLVLLFFASAPKISDNMNKYFCTECRKSYREYEIKSFKQNSHFCPICNLENTDKAI